MKCKSIFFEFQCAFFQQMLPPLHQKIDIFSDEFVAKDYPNSIPTQVVIEKLSWRRKDQEQSHFRPIDIRQVELSLDDHEKSLQHSSFY